MPEKQSSEWTGCLAAEFLKKEGVCMPRTDDEESGKKPES
jgi:hypothetical protein